MRKLIVVYQNKNISNMTQRCKRLRGALTSVTCSVDSQRAILLTQSYKETAGESEIIRRVKALEKVLAEININIFDEELIVGYPSDALGKAQIFPEMAVDWIEKELLVKGKFSDKKMGREFKITDDIRSEIKNIISFWKRRTLKHRVFESLPEKTKIARKALLFNLAMHEDSGLGHVILDYPRLLKEGLNGIIDQIEKKLDDTKINNSEDLSKTQFWKAAIIMCQSVINYAGRYAKLARRMAQESDENRRLELEKIATALEWVPANPARGFHEALQSVWLLQMIVSELETNGSSVSLGRFDQYIFPYYKRDIDEKRITREEAEELLDCFFMKLASTYKVRPMSRRTLHGGFTRFQNLTIGGQTKDGGDATNEVTYMVLDARSRVQTADPQLSLRIHSGTPESLLFRAVQLISQGGGHPALYNDDVIIQSFLKRGVPLEFARNYGIVGCVELSFLGLWSRADGGYINLPKCLELALNDGIERLTEKRISVSTGDPKQFRNFENVLKAFEEQLDYVVSQNVIENNLIDVTHEHFIPHILTSCLVPGCIDNGKDVTAGGANYGWTTPLGVGIADVADSLAAIKKHVFDDKRITMHELLYTLEKNFEGREALQHRLLRTPKYGNDYDYVDSIATNVCDIYCRTLEKYSTNLGRRFLPSLYSLTSNIPLGEVTGALPSGRKAREPFADGISPAHGADTLGPTAVLKSVAKISQVKATGGVILNQKYDPSLLRNRRDLKSFIDLFKTYFQALNGAQVQFNIIDRQTLLDAQKNPEKYRNLIVRVTGYSAFFVDLSQPVQEDIIGRTNLSRI